MGRRICALALAVAAWLTLGAAAQAAPGLVVGVSDDTLRDDPARAAGAVIDLGLSAVRLTFTWNPGETRLSATDEAKLAAAIAAVPGVEIVVSAYSRTAMPLDDEAREDYCAYLASFPARFSEIDHVVVWNEVNKSTFWRPQFEGRESAAPRDYAALLARCYDAVKAVRPDVTVIGAALSSTGNDNPDAHSNVSHSPGAFVRKLGEAYRASGRKAPLFDWLGLHAYGESSVDPPWKLHAGSSTISMGDLNTLLQALYDGFAGTAQPVPGGGGSAPPLIAIMENGYQTATPDNHGSYVGAENVPTLAARAHGATAPAAPTQASQLVDAIRIAYCHPSVAAYFNFLLADEPDRGRWQSGVLYADWTKKPSYDALKGIAARVRADTVDCSGLPESAIAPFRPAGALEVRRIAWPRARSFNWKHELWRFRVQALEPATYVATLSRVGSSRAILTATGSLKRLYFSFVTFPRKRLQPGRYTFRIVLTSAESQARTKTLTSPPFTVRPRTADGPEPRVAGRGGRRTGWPTHASSVSPR